MNTGRKVYLVSCGSFNPITHMHLRIFEICKDFLKDKGIEVSGGIVSPVNDAYQKKDLISSEHRLQMARLACNSSSWIAVDDWESKQKDLVRSRVVLDHFQTSLEDKTQCQVQTMLICGLDLLQSFHVPGLWSDEDMEIIFAKHHICCVGRDDLDFHQIVDFHPIMKNYKKYLHFVPPPCRFDLSSTLVRSLVKQQKSIKYYVDENVIDYIHKNSLYQSIPLKYQL